MMYHMISGGGIELGRKVRKLLAGWGKGKRRFTDSESEGDHGDSNWVPSHDIGEEASSYAGNVAFDDDNASDEDVEINCQAYVGLKKNWNSTEYTRAQNTYQYGLDNDGIQPHFYTMIQQDAFYGHLLRKNIFDHK